jgi:nicotinate-nucleotide pyrophosphorylase
MEKAIAEVADYAKKNKVEINIDKAGKVSLWCEVDKNDFTIDNVKVSEIKKAVFALSTFRHAGWKSN